MVFDLLGDGLTGAAIQSLAPRGRLVTFGTSAGPTGTIPLQALYRSALRIVGYGGLRDSDGSSAPHWPRHSERWPTDTSTSPSARRCR